MARILSRTRFDTRAAAEPPPARTDSAASRRVDLEEVFGPDPFHLAETRAHRSRSVFARIVDELTDALDVLVEPNAEAGGDDVQSRTEHMGDPIIPVPDRVRRVADGVGKVVPDDLWPVPTNRDTLCITWNRPIRTRETDA